MGSKLIKETRITYTPGSPGVPGTPGTPATPAYCSIKRETRCQFWPTPDPRTGGTYRPTATWDCREVITQTCYPAIPEIPPTPGVPATQARIEYDYNLGWNAGARSVDVLTGSGGYGFQADVGIVGAIVGLNDEDLGYGYFDIDHAWYFTNGIARIMERGVIKLYVGSYVQADVFRVERLGSLVLYKKNETLVYTSLLASTGTVFLDVSLYSGGDTIWCPYIYAVHMAQAALGGGGVIGLSDNMHATLPGGGVQLASPRLNGVADLQAVMPGGGVQVASAYVTRALSAVWGGGGVLAAEEGISTISGNITLDGILIGAGVVYGEITGEFPAFTGQLVGGIQQPTYAFVNGAISMTGLLFGYTGEVGQITGNITLAGLMADHAYGAISGEIPAPLGILFGGTPGVAYMGSLAEFQGTMEPQIDIVLVMNSSFELLSVMFVDHGAIAEMISNLSLNSTMTLALSLIAEMISQFSFGASLPAGGTTVSGTGGVGQSTAAGAPTVWVVNVETEASSRYESYDFTSFAHLDGVDLGCREDGIYALDGATDAGAPIEAMVNLGLLDFEAMQAKDKPDAASSLKGIEAIYLGVSSTGRMVVKIVANGQSYAYYSRTFSDIQKQQRVDPGKGLRANYFDIEVWNEAGADFDLATVRFIPVQLTRRI